MSRRIIKKRGGPNASASQFQFQAAYPDDAGGPQPMSELEADAELDAFMGQPAQAPPPPSHAPPGMAPGAPQVQVNIEEIIGRAQTDADQIIRQASERANQIEREAYERGLEEGRKTGEIMAEQQLQLVLNQYQAGLQALDKSREALINQAKLDILDMILHVAQKVVHGELRGNPQAILPILRDAIQSLKQRKNVTIYMNPEDHQFVAAISESERTGWLGTQVELQVEPGLTRGGIRLETPEGELDASVETQFQLIAEHLAQVDLS